MRGQWNHPLGDSKRAEGPCELDVGCDVSGVWGADLDEGPVSELGPLHVPQRPVGGRIWTVARVQARDTELDVRDGDGALAALPSMRAMGSLRAVMVVAWARFTSARARIWRRAAARRSRTTISIGSGVRCASARNASMRGTSLVWDMTVCFLPENRDRKRVVL